MVSRAVVDLRWARELAARPTCIPKGRPRGTKRLGVKFEREFGEELAKRFGEVKLGQWFEFEDINGHGYCQTDAILLLGGVAYVFECKLTQVMQGYVQLRKLYFPIVREVYGKEPRGVVVVRHLTRRSDVSDVVDCLGNAIIRANGVIPTLHWLGGRAPL